MWRNSSMPACRATAVAASIKRAPAAALGVAVILGSAGGMVWGEAPFYAASFEKPPTPAAMAAVGRALFFDTALSASGRLACATCHSPLHAFGPANDLPVQHGGANNSRPGVRAVPSLTYTQNIPSFTEHFFDAEEDDSIDQGPAGGHTWDGRAQSAHDQARIPLLSPFEMANPSPKEVAAKVRRASYAAEFRDTFGEHVFADPALVFKGVLLALETYEQTPSEFYPYTSKYDAYLRGKTSLTTQELRGLAAFDDPARGNCARCHPSAVSGGAFPQFTDYGYAAIGVPRNAAIPANSDPRYFDLGLCGPLRTDLTHEPEYCGQFRTPSLRNVAVRRVFFHNGVFHRLEDVVRFYAERDTDPQKWYPRASDGSVLKFDDLPAKYRRNVDKEPPFDRNTGGRPAMSEADIADIVAFLRTLTDGFVRNGL
jgi:cytochrome c peroxidase